MSATLPDNLKSRLARVHVVTNSFKDDSGKDVSYKRLVIAGFVKGEDIEIELKADKKDLTLLSLFDVIEDQSVLGNQE